MFHYKLTENLIYNEIVEIRMSKNLFERRLSHECVCPGARQYGIGDTVQIRDFAVHPTPAPPT